MNIVRNSTKLIVADDGKATITIQVPADLAPGEYEANVLIQLDDQPPFGTSPSKFTFSSYDVGPWPEGFTVSRDQIYDDDGR